MVHSDLLQYLKGQILETPPLLAVDLEGQTIVITGANSGLGFEAAKHIYKMNVCYLILACRSLERGETARKAIMASSRLDSPGKVDVWQLDMSDYSSVLAFGDCIKGLTTLDAFIANAGIDMAEFVKVGGHESTLTVNVISTLLIAMLVIPKLRESSKVQKKASHLVFTGSVVHIYAKHKALSEPKTGQIFKTLVNRSEPGQSSVILNFVHPGWCKTELFKTNDGGMGRRVALRLMGRTSEEGGRPLVHRAVADEKSHGKYLAECRVKQESSWARSDEGHQVQEQLWPELVDILEGIQPSVINLE
ncbi:Short chain dehydrogenase [Lachnellula subtilissima]|uniref:Short chain dehydrogenase n=1 Tax=Lachnellula subtilissima TaxID=602034 RepID=A0A8H8RLI6_9HELO|nr:Short chain dehydrogenase [Lachnellula subtilissima]